MVCLEAHGSLLLCRRSAVNLCVSTSEVLVQSFSYPSLMPVFLMSAYNLFITVISLSLSANLTAFYGLLFLLVTIIFSCFSACLVIFIRCWTLKLFYIVGCWILQHHFKYSWGFVLEMQLSYPESVRAGVWWSFSPWLIQPFTNSLQWYPSDALNQRAVLNPPSQRLKTTL